MGLPDKRRDEFALRFRDGEWRMDRREQTDGMAEVAIRGTPGELVQRLRDAGIGDRPRARQPYLTEDDAPGQYRVVTLRTLVPPDTVTFTLWPNGEHTLVSARPSVSSRVAWLYMIAGAFAGLSFAMPPGGFLMFAALAISGSAALALVLRRAFFNDADIRRGEKLANHFTRALEGRIHEGDPTEDPFREE